MLTNKLCRVYSGARFNVKGKTSIVQECLRSFPYLWASVIRVFIFDGYLLMLGFAQLLVCECQSLLTLFMSTEQTMLCSTL